MTASEWVWFGQAGHFIAANWCRFHLHTHVGKYCVSTVGDYHPPTMDHGRLVVPASDWPMETIGWQRSFETMVFVLVDGETNGSEIDFSAYEDRDAANAGHLEMCRKYAATVEQELAEVAS